MARGATRAAPTLRAALPSGYHCGSARPVTARSHPVMTDAKPSEPTLPPRPADRREPAPEYRPLERFWPYRDLPEQPDEEELAGLDPDLRDALFGPGDRPFSVTLVFPRFEGPEYARAVELARGANDYREVGEGDRFRSRARFLPSDALKLRDLFNIVGEVHGTEVLIDDRPLPFARELWLPLLWFLIPR
jgi:hypothetical protein